MSEAPDMSLILLLILGLLFSQPTLLPAVLLVLVFGVGGPAAIEPAAVSARPEALSCDSGVGACAMLQAGRSAGPVVKPVADAGAP